MKGGNVIPSFGNGVRDKLQQSQEQSPEMIENEASVESVLGTEEGLKESDFCQWTRKYSDDMLYFEPWFNKYSKPEDEFGDVDIGVSPPHDIWMLFVNKSNITEGWNPEIGEFAHISGRGNFRIAAADCWSMLEEVENTGCKIPVDSCYNTKEKLETCVKVLDTTKETNFVRWKNYCQSEKISAYYCMRKMTDINEQKGGCRIKGCLDGNWEQTLCEGDLSRPIPLDPPVVQPTMEPIKHVEGEDGTGVIPFPDMQLNPSKGYSMDALPHSFLPLIVLLYLFNYEIIGSTLFF